MPINVTSPWQLNKELFFIAEIGVNHNGDMELARRLIDLAADVGANAVKFQTFRAEQLVTPDAKTAEYQARNAPGADLQFDMLKKLELPGDDHHMLARHCAKRGITFMSTPFDEDSADLLEEIGVDCFKVSSGDLTHLSLLAHIAQKGRPMIISTGMANLAETEEAVETIARAGNPPLAILHCVTDYPSDPAQSNLRVMATLASAFGKPVGWSDHSQGEAVALAAAAMGARIIEKHITLDKSLPGPDHKASLDPDELRSLVKNIRIVESALGDGIKQPSEAELKVARIARRSLVANCDIRAGQKIEPHMLAARRPGTGLAPRYANDIVGSYALCDIAKNTAIDRRYIAGSSMRNKSGARDE